MSRHRSTLGCLLGVHVFLVAAAAAEPAPGKVIFCRGACDGSAAVALPGQRFITVSDEDHLVRVYSAVRDGGALQTFDLSRFLETTGKSSEADVEDAALLGDRVYWIGSHSRNEEGKQRPGRRCFFATTLTYSNDTVRIEPVGRPYRKLVEDLARDPKLQAFQFDDAARRAPREVGGLNIEGLCATPEGQLLIGFRNPVPAGKALLVPLLNPAEVVAGQRAKFGDAILLDLGGLGIRGMTRAKDRYYLIAGHSVEGGRSRLFEWMGGTAPARPLNCPEVARLNPEGIALLELDGAERLLVVSDDSSLKTGGAEGRDIRNPELKYFRALTLER